MRASAFRPPAPVKLFCGLIAAGEDVLRAAVGELAERFGPIDVASETVPFTFTDYYAAEMGTDLLRHFVSFERLIDPGCLADIKVATVAMEARHLRRTASGAAAGRGVNLDPGIITPANLVLATTKNFAHRIYLSQGIYAEVTLLFRKQATVALEWTYPDFRSEMCQRFVLEARRRLMGG